MPHSLALAKEKLALEILLSKIIAILKMEPVVPKDFYAMATQPKLAPIIILEILALVLINVLVMDPLHVSKVSANMCMVQENHARLTLIVFFKCAPTQPQNVDLL